LVSEAHVARDAESANIRRANGTRYDEQTKGR
jgi:hypothetical protein